MNIRPLALFALSACTLGAYADDTIRVNRALIEGPVVLRQAFVTDSMNLSGKRHDVSEILKNNANLAKRKFTSTESLSYGSPIGRTATNDSVATLSALRFTVDAPSWTKASLHTPNMGQKAVYLDGKEVNGDLKFLPGRHEVTILDYATAEAKDSFNVELVGKDIHRLVVNPETPRIFDIDINRHGERFGDVSMSPSGRYIVTHYSNTLVGGEVEWRTVMTDMTTQKNIFSGNYLRFQWLPKRDILYYTRKSQEGLDLVYLDPATMKETTVATGLPEGRFTMSPDESFLIITKENKGPQPQGALKRLYDSDDRMPGWRDREDPFLYDLKTGITQRITFGKESCWVNDISQDGQHILFSLRRHDATRQPMDHTDIYEMDVKTGETRTLLADAAWIEGADYTADGQQLLLTASGAAFDGIGSEVSEGQHPQDYQHTLFLYDPATEKAQLLLPNFKPSVDNIYVNSADGLIYMICEDGYNRNIWCVNPTTTERYRLNLPVSFVSRFDFSCTKNPQLVFYGQNATNSRNAYITTLSKLKFVKDEVTYGTNIVRGDTIPCIELAANPVCKPFGEISFDKLFPGLRTPSCTEWDFKATRGDKVKGFYFLPADYDESKSYPMIVYYYGGCSPTARILEYAYPLAAWANMGYVVLALEPSGAAGFGQEFAARHVNTWGKESGDDIIEGVQRFCEEHAFVDPTKIGCIGASYGGFMTEYLQTRTDIFACAVSHAGISNIASYWGGGYWGYSYGECAEYGSFPWNNPRLFTEQSPLFNADKIHTPLLLLHGTADTNVPTTESQQLFTALKILGRDVTYITVDGENHIINDYSKREQWSEAIYAWFAKYLQCDSSWWEDLGY